MTANSLHDIQIADDHLGRLHIVGLADHYAWHAISDDSGATYSSCVKIASAQVDEHRPTVEIMSTGLIVAGVIIADTITTYQSDDDGQTWTEQGTI